ncbi:MAG: 2Fe-2S ferredoxin [Candidatus Omnitrophica bacterium]|nr:2Fe-2S ferredoxin [Candidatus Omnitrophota bacterium]
MPTVRYLPAGQVVRVEPGISVLDAALDAGIGLYHTCGGNASCSTCRVIVREGQAQLSVMEAVEAQVLDAFDLRPPYRLACQALVLGGDIVVEIPGRERAPRPNKTPPLPEGAV